MKNNLLPIAKEGWNYIAGAFVAFVVFSFFDSDFLEFFAFLSILFFIYVFRNPEREIINFQQASVISPVDGVVSAIEELKDTEYSYRVEIDSSYFSVGLLRVPLTSSLIDVKVYNGSRLSKSSTSFNDLNENATLIFSDNNKNIIKVNHRLKQSFKSIKIEAIKSQNLHQGARYGFMVNGITTLYLPKNFRLNLSVGSELCAAESLVGYFTK